MNQPTNLLGAGLQDVGGKVHVEADGPAQSESQRLRVVHRKIRRAGPHIRLHQGHWVGLLVVP